MKRYWWILVVWFLALTTTVSSKDSTYVKYRIYFDSENASTYEIKDDVQQIFTYLVRGLDDNSYATIVMRNLDKFEAIPKVKATWKRNTLILTQGDGQGGYIKGKLKQEGICMEQVQPKSFILELFQ